MPKKPSRHATFNPLDSRIDTYHDIYQEVALMTHIEKAKVFMTGRSQAVRIPAQYRFKTDEVYIRHDPRTGEITLSERPKQPSLTEIFKMLDEAVTAEGPLELDRDMSFPEEREWS